ncbi:MAG TPA: hypothetical protein VN695_21440 [Streptosporangiaceae bacterium]|nr:hypothetical protein [Streptosporangiaceae bacterium]
MNDYRAAGQELQDQVLAAARKGQRRVATTIKNVTAAAQQIGPQLASMPKPTLNLSALPGHAQLRDRAPALVGKLPGQLQTKLPTADQLKASAENLVGHAVIVQRRVVDQVRTAATPLAQQAAARLSQFSAPAAKPAPDTKAGTTTRVSEVTVARTSKAKDDKAKGGQTTTTRTRQTSATRKPARPKPADK